MVGRRRAFPSLALLALGPLLAAAAGAAPKGPREHPRGVWGQDELRRSIRQLENDSDRLVESWQAAGEGVSGSPSELALAGEGLLGLERDLDELRDAYADRARSETLAAIEALLPLEEPLFLSLAALDPPKAIRDAWDQVSIDFRRLAHEADAATGGREGWMPAMPDRDEVRVAVAEIEDLSDELKRYLLRTEPREAAAEWQVAKGGGRERFLVHDARLERALLDFEVAADELKALCRKSEHPSGVRPLVDRLARSARTIDYSMSEASVPEEARREWREVLPELELLLRAQGLHGIGEGWETHR